MNDATSEYLALGTLVATLAVVQHTDVLERPARRRHAGGATGGGHVRLTTAVGAGIGTALGWAGSDITGNPSTAQRVGSAVIGGGIGAASLGVPAYLAHRGYNPLKVGAGGAAAGTALGLNAALGEQGLCRENPPPVGTAQPDCGISLRMPLQGAAIWGTAALIAAYANAPPAHRARGGHVTIRGGTTQDPHRDAARYIQAMHNAGKKRYANRWYFWKYVGGEGRGEPEPERGELSAMAAQAVRMNLEHIAQGRARRRGGSVRVLADGERWRREADGVWMPTGAGAGHHLQLDSDAAMAEYARIIDADARRTRTLAPARYIGGPTHDSRLARVFAGNAARGGRVRSHQRRAA